MFALVVGLAVVAQAADDDAVIGDWEVTTVGDAPLRADAWTPDRDATLTVACIDHVVKLRVDSASAGKPQAGLVRVDDRPPRAVTDLADLPLLDDLATASHLHVEWVVGASPFVAEFGLDRKSVV